MAMVLSIFALFTGIASLAILAGISFRLTRLEQWASLMDHERRNNSVPD